MSPSRSGHSVVSVGGAAASSAHQPRLSPGDGAAPVSPVSRGQAARTPTHSYSPAHSVTRASASPASTLTKLEARRPQPPLSPAAAPHTNGGPTRLGSPFWCGLGSRDPQSRTFEFPERDVPLTSSQSSVRLSSTNTPPTYKHVTNLLIDKATLGDKSLTSPTGYNLHLPVPAYDSFSKNNIQSEDPCLTSDNEDEDSIAEAETEHPAIKQGRSSFIKYNSSSKLKPKRKIVNHVNKAAARGEKF